jgi:membrane fusion protein, heavy metal efflux system
MSALGNKKRWLAVGFVMLAIVAGAIAWRVVVDHLQTASQEAGRSAPVAKAPLDSIELTPRVVKMGGIKTALVTLPTRPRMLELRGSLNFDSNRLVPVHTRFPGQIMEIGQIEVPPEKSLGNAPVKRPLSYTDPVNKGQRLAVLWSKDLGEKKSEMVDALARLKLDEVRLSRLKDLVERGSISEASVREAERAVDVGLIAVSKAELTLRSWALREDEIAKIKAEAEFIHKRQSIENEQAEDWARVEILAPIDGTIVEKTAVRGEYVDSTVDLFKIADLSVLSVWLHAYEEDLPYLQRLPRPIHAQIRLPSNPEIGVLEATVDRIGDIIDPNEHMALLLGSVGNSTGQLKTGQFVSATIEIGTEPNVVEIPTTALVDDGNDSYVFVQPDPQVPRFELRRVSVVRRHFDVVYVRSRLTDVERQQGLQELHTGETIVSRGALELKEDLMQQRAAQGSQ